MQIQIVPCLKDNYSYLLTCEKTGESAIVDASEGAPVLAACAKLLRRPLAIWSTHHHLDHTGANEEVAKALGIEEIVGHESDKGRIAGQTRFVIEGDVLELGELHVDILHIPGHTTGAVAYVVKSGEERAVFTGDTLFVAGCGRLFEGTPEMMYASLQKLAALPKGTKVYCGHEYTESNLRFAKHVEPSNRDVDAAIDRAKLLRSDGKPTIPSTIADELAINPFVRARNASDLGTRRAEKDVFR